MFYWEGPKYVSMTGLSFSVSCSKAHLFNCKVSLNIFHVSIYISVVYVITYVKYQTGELRNKE